MSSYQPTAMKHYNTQELIALIANLRKVSALLNSEDKIDGVSGLWLSHRVERTNEFLDTLIDDLQYKASPDSPMPFDPLP